MIALPAERGTSDVCMLFLFVNTCFYVFMNDFNGFYNFSGFNETHKMLAMGTCCA